MKKVFFTFIGIALLASCTKSIEDTYKNVDSSMIFDTIVENDAVNSDEWVERWVCRIGIDTLNYINHVPGIPTNPSWIEYRMTRYGEDSIYLLSRTIVHPTYDYVPNRVFFFDNDAAWFAIPFDNIRPSVFSIHHDTLVATSTDEYALITYYWKIHEQTDSYIDIEALYSEHGNIIDDAMFTITYDWRGIFHIYRQ